MTKQTNQMYVIVILYNVIINTYCHGDRVMSLTNDVSHIITSLVLLAGTDNVIGFASLIHTNTQEVFISYNLLQTWTKCLFRSRCLFLVCILII